MGCLKLTYCSEVKMSVPGDRLEKSTVLRCVWNATEQQKNRVSWYDYGHRFYDPQIGRFISLDPLAEFFPYMTCYQYASNNPVKNIDLDGLEGICLLGATDLLKVGGTDETPLIEGLNKAGGEIGGKTVETGSKASDATTKPVETQQHHISSNQFKENEVVKTARDNGFKQDGAENKMDVEKYSKSDETGQHGNHPEYNKEVGKRLDNFKENKPDYTGKDAVDFVRDMVKDLKQTIENNPNTKINDLFKTQPTPADATKVVTPVKVLEIQTQQL